MEAGYAVGEETTCRERTSVVEILVKFIKKTKLLLTHLETESPSIEREEYIGTIHQLLDEREQLLSQLPDLHALNENVKEELIQLETKIQSLLSNQKSAIKQDLQLLQLQKKKTNKYADPYGNVSVDGMFLDKKK
ncbi:hypothetical protein BGM26_19970 [Bacillus sp. FJAT-29790]|uniref:hypothetical protein n=1 Tax=Bacillus sp. FJAT-29790 TaxID=1895002 RepID=UPI001C238271|nr:hypothetical protein [Bacillus sp. FJAT-29790]MBU8881205.1 hypothetical protein [Bacillus sp. FJAT-29790]